MLYCIPLKNKLLSSPASCKPGSPSGSPWGPLAEGEGAPADIPSQSSRAEAWGLEPGLAHALFILHNSELTQFKLYAESRLGGGLLLGLDQLWLVKVIWGTTDPSPRRSETAPWGARNSQRAVSCGKVQLPRDSTKHP